MFAECRAQLPQWWNEKRFRSVDQTLIMCEMVDPSTSTPARVACAAAIKTKKAEKIARKVMTGQIEGYYLGDKMQRTICHIQSND